MSDIDEWKDAVLQKRLGVNLLMIAQILEGKGKLACLSGQPIEDSTIIQYELIVLCSETYFS